MKVLVVSDLHFAGDREKARRGYEARVIRNPLLRGLTHVWRHYVWLREPDAHNHRLDQIIAANPAPDLVVANGDFTIDSGFVGVADDAARDSARLALQTLRHAYGERLHATLGDHDLGKKSLFGGQGGPRLASLERCLGDLGLSPFWRRDVGNWVLAGATSTALGWPIFEPESLPEERGRWQAFQQEQFARVRALFDSLQPEQRLILFLHDPSALAFLWRDPAIRARLPQVAHTIVGHLHTPAILALARRLAGMPRLTWLGHAARRYSSALREARCWSDFRVTLCPSPTGCQLLKDGGWLELELPPGSGPAVLRRHRLAW